MPHDNLLHADLTGRILECYYQVYNTLGYGFLEKVYETALMRSLQKAGLRVVRQVPVGVWFEGEIVGEYFADLIVKDRVIIEVKAVEKLCEEHDAQLVNYLKATRIEVGLLLNYGKRPEFRRRVFSNVNKRTGNPPSFAEGTSLSDPH